MTDKVFLERKKGAEDSEVLWLEKGKKVWFWDPNSFRPDPRDFLKVGSMYKSNIRCDTENLPSGEIINFPRLITVFEPAKSDFEFVNVR